MKGVLYVLACIVFVAATVLGCAWYAETSQSVRFNSYQTEREMARLPPLPNLAGDTNSLRVRWIRDINDDLYGERQKSSDDIDDVWDRTESAEQDGDLKLDRQLLREYLDRTAVRRDYSVFPTDRQKRRNSAIDRLDALTALEHGSSAARVEEYLALRRSYDDGKPADEELKSLRQLESDANLKDNVAYLNGARLYADQQFEKAAGIFGTFARRFPNSEKREAAMFMLGLSLLKTSTAYTPTSGDEAHLHEHEPAKQHAVEIDQAWRDSLAGFKRVIAAYPHGRYANDAHGWIAYLLLRKGDRAGALVEYYRLLTDRKDENARVEATFSLELVRHHATYEEMDVVEKQLANEPDVALVYAYHNLYNYAIDPGSPDWLTEDDEASQKQKSSIEQKERTRILVFGQKLMNRYPNLAVGAAFALRAAQASLESDKNEAALQFAKRALQGPINDEQRAQALWTRGVAEHRLHQFDAAHKSFNTLLQSYPKSQLVEGARRSLAMIAEDAGDIEGALDQYIALDYRLDVAYFVDALMTPDQLATFIEHHPQSPKKNELTYALGLRYLRANRWNDARKIFTQVRAVSDPKVYSKDEFDPKDFSDRNLDEGPPPITVQMVMRDVQTANDLERLQGEVSQAAGTEAAAEAIYQLASYQYQASPLLFYNPTLWDRQRYFSLSYLASDGRYRAPNESQTLFAYMQEHDTLARALKIYLDLVDRYPHTRAAQDALYTAAVCHERLAKYNDYWRGIYAAGLHSGSRMVSYANVKAAYPNYQLPRGTYGWQPSTRTVNDGPGFEAPPKYVPPPTRMQRLKAMAEKLVRLTWTVWDQTLRRWVIFIALVAGVWFTWRLAKRSRTLLKPFVARLHVDTPKASVDPHWITLFSKGPEEQDLRDKLVLFLSERSLEFRQLACDASTRLLLLRNIVVHSVLAILVVKLLWFLHFG